MTLSSPKGSSAISSFPRSLSVIAVAVGGLAMFLMVASLLLVSRPIGSTVRGYFYGVDSLSEVDLAVSPYNDSGVAHSVDKSVDVVGEVPSSTPFSEVYTGSNDSSASVENKELEYPVNPVPPVSSGLPLGEEGNSSSKNDKLIENIEITKPVSSDAPDGSAYSASGTTPSSTLLGKRAAANTSVEIGILYIYPMRILVRACLSFLSDWCSELDLGNFCCIVDCDISCNLRVLVFLYRN